MAVVLATVFAAGLAMYAGLGLLFAIVFVSAGLGAVDPSADGAPWRFRLIIVPGVAALWPWMLTRWKNSRARRPP